MIVFAGQELGMRFWAVFSSTVLATLGLLAGGVLMFVEHNVGKWDIDVPGAFNAMAALGVMGIALAWCLYMAVLAVALGYRRTDLGDTVIAVLFLLTGGYYGFVIIASFLPFVNVTPSVM